MEQLLSAAKNNDQRNNDKDNEQFSEIENKQNEEDTQVSANKTEEVTRESKKL